VQLESSDQIALIAAGFSQLLCLRIATEFTSAASASSLGCPLLPIGGGLGVMLPSSLVDQPSSGTTTGAQSSDDIDLIFESIIQFSIELSKLDLDVAETAMFAAATLVQPGAIRQSVAVLVLQKGKVANAMLHCSQGLMVLTA